MIQVDEIATKLKDAPPCLVRKEAGAALARAAGRPKPGRSICAIADRELACSVPEKAIETRSRQRATRYFSA